MEQRIRWLIKQMIDRRSSASEEEELAAILRTGEYDTVLADAIGDVLTLEEDPAFDPENLQHRVAEILALDKGSPGLHKKTGRQFFLGGRKWQRYAAAVLVITGMVIWFMGRNHRVSPEKNGETAESFPDLKPGGNRAVLTLDDGSVIALDSATQGMVSQQGRSDVVKVSGGVLAYRSGAAGSGGAREGKIYYNTISTPKGGQYEIVLPDGSRVWLNAASSLRFPTSFAGPSREVYLKGEGYFEIAADAGKPFYTRVEGVSVEVLGTSFDINAYTDEKVMRTTLLDGRVRVRTSHEAAVMQPGQQAEVTVTSVMTPNTAPIKLVDKANLEEAVAWKNGSFYLENTDIAALMRQIGRWYDIDIVFEGGIPSGHITGKVPRNTALPKILRLLKLSGVHFRVEEKKIIVSS